MESVTLKQSESTNEWLIIVDGVTIKSFNDDRYNSKLEKFKRIFDPNCSLSKDEFKMKSEQFIISEFLIECE